MLKSPCNKVKPSTRKRLQASKKLSYNNTFVIDIPQRLQEKENISALEDSK